MKEERTYTYLVWQYKDYEPIGVLIDKFVETQIELCLLDMEGASE